MQIQRLWADWTPPGVPTIREACIRRRQRPLEGWNNFLGRRSGDLRPNSEDSD